MEDELIVFTLANLSTVNSTNLPLTFAVSANKDYLNIREKYVYAYIISWFLLTDEESVKRISTLIDGQIGKQELLEEFHRECGARRVDAPSAIESDS